MTRYTYERLSYEDNGFLLMETPTLPMHVAATQIFRAGPLATADGGIDIASIRRLTESVLHRVPRYRQKLAWIPGADRAVWVDDPHFSLAYHMRHTSLPRPGSDAQLKVLAARIMEQPLDRSRPLWETWIVEGLDGGRFGVISKIHHCMIDGISGVDLSQIIQSPSPTTEIGEPRRFIPRPTPTAVQLRRDGLRWRLGLPYRWARGVYDLVRTSPSPLDELSRRARAVAGFLGWYLRGPSETPLNGPVGPHRAFDWLTLPLADVKAVRHELDCKINDIVLATVTGAIRELLIRRQVRPAEIDFRVAAPVNVRVDADRGRMGNKVSTWVVPLPLVERDPLRQLAAIHRTTREARDSHQELGTEVMLSILDGLPFAPSPSLASRPVNTIVTNVPGPPFPLYLLGAEMLECFPQAPLLANMGLTVGVLSYNGRMCFGINADYDRVPDLSDFVLLLRRSFERLAGAAATRPEQASGRKRPGRAGQAKRRGREPGAANGAGRAPAQGTRH